MFSSKSTKERNVDAPILPGLISQANITELVNINEKKSEMDQKKYDEDNDKKKLREMGKTKKLYVWFWRHPFTRLSTVILIMILNFLIYAIDPVAESRRDVELPIAGSLWSIIASGWRGEAHWLILRFIVCLLTFIAGPVFGWYIVHRNFLKGYLNLRMFGYYSDAEKDIISEEERDEHKGSWFTMSITTLFWGWLWVLIYNLLVPAEYEVDEWLGVSEYVFGQMAATLSWVGDSFTFCMILDSMLQARVYYDYSFIKNLQDEWNELCGGYFRIVIVWVCFTIGSFVVIVLVWIKNDSMFETWRLKSGITTFEPARAFIAALIFALDLCTVTQDWDFPYFRNTEKIKITGFNVFEVSFPPEFIKTIIPNNLTFKINGKWMNYTPMVLVMGLDMAAFIAIAWYEPGEFAQYVGPDQKIWSVSDYGEANQLGTQYDTTQTYDLLNYTVRAGQCIDMSEQWCTNTMLCNWYDRLGYCTFGNDVKLAGSFENSASLWWTCIPIVLSFMELVWSLVFIRSALPNAPRAPTHYSKNSLSSRLPPMDGP